MNKPTYSLRELFAAAAFVSLALAAFTQASRMAGSMILSISVATLTGFLLSAIFSDGSRRAFCAGFAITGWIYWLLVWFIPREYELITILSYEEGVRQLRLMQDTSEEYKRAIPVIVHALWSLMFGYLGGLLARHFHDSRRDHQSRDGSQHDTE